MMLYSCHNITHPLHNIIIFTCNIIPHLTVNQHNSITHPSIHPSCSLSHHLLLLAIVSQLLDILSNEAHADVISWLPHGTGFQIHKKKTFAAGTFHTNMDLSFLPACLPFHLVLLLMTGFSFFKNIFTEILPIYFKASKFTSFTRKLNRWGFTRVPRGPETGAYFHKLFRRDKPELCLQMTSNSGNKYQAHPMMMNPAVALHHPPPSLLMPGMMPPGMPPMFPFMNPMMAAAAAASTNNTTTSNNGTTTGTTTTGMTPQQQQQAMWQQQMHQMMMFQQQQMMQAQMQQGGGNTATNQGFPMMGMPPLPTFPTNMMMNSNNNTANNTTNNNNNNSMNPNTGAPTGSSSNNAMPHPGTSLTPHMNNQATGTTNNNMNKPSGGGGDGSLSSLNPANNNATNTAASLLVPPVLKTEDDDDDDDDHPGVMVGLGNHSLADDDDEDAPLGGTAHAKTV